MRSSGITKLAVLAVAVLTIPAGAAQAAQVTAPQVPVSHLTGFHQIVVDNAAGYIFLSEGADSYGLGASTDSSSALVVTTLAGTYVTTLESGNGVEGMALTPDGKTLYV